MEKSKISVKIFAYSSLLISLFLVLAGFASAAPAPWGIAINNETEECAGFWPGDEYVGYHMPPGWKAYFPGEGDTITTEYGSCVFRKDVGDTAGEEEKCCNEMGLKFYSSNIGEAGVFSSPYLNMMAVGAIVLIAFLAVIGSIVYWIVKRVKGKE